MKSIADIAVVIAVLAVAMLMRVIYAKGRAFWLARKADATHRALVEEARHEWTLKQDYKIECEWTREGKPSSKAGWVVLFAEQNSLGERRVRIVHKPNNWPVEGMKMYADLKAWEASAQPRSLPRPDRVPA